MNSGFYAACTGLLASSQSLDIAANNLANMNTTGFRSQTELFRSLVERSGGTPMSSLNQAINDYGVIGGTYMNSGPGHLEDTGNPLDFALEGPGLFTVQTKAGVRYTRNGAFRVDTDGNLLTAEGDAVLGDQGPIKLPSGEVSVSTDGTISIAGTLVTKLRLVEADPSALVAEGNTYFQAAEGAVQPASSTRVRQGMLEGSNVEPVSASINLLNVQRHAELLERTLHVFYSIFDATAAQQLSSVT
jgi:flagellar basal-body rod protein FlgF/flagellar basal-body rod protein FlgG